MSKRYQMSKKDLSDYNSLATKAEKAQWLLDHDFTARLTINPSTCSPAYQVYCAGASLPGYFPSEQAGIKHIKKWLQSIINKKCNITN